MLFTMVGPIMLETDSNASTHARNIPEQMSTEDTRGVLAQSNHE